MFSCLGLSDNSKFHNLLSYGFFRMGLRRYQSAGSYGSDWIDTIHAEIIVEGGSLSFKIQKDDEAPVYEGVDVSFSDEFDVDIEESGTYTVTVTGEKAKGSVSFTVVTNQ